MFPSTTIGRLAGTRNRHPGHGLRIVLMAGSVILTLPLVVMFFASEKWLAGGLTAGAEKG